MANIRLDKGVSCEEIYKLGELAKQGDKKALSAIIALAYFNNIFAQEVLITLAPESQIAGYAIEAMENVAVRASARR